jgi:hypothetical protein
MVDDELLRVVHLAMSRLPGAGFLSIVWIE